MGAPKGSRAYRLAIRGAAGRFGAATLRHCRKELDTYRRVVKHPRTPRAARWCLALAIGYLLSPVDLVPDFIPILGHFDDIVIVVSLVFLARQMISADVWRDCRRLGQSRP